MRPEMTPDEVTLRRRFDAGETLTSPEMSALSTLAAARRERSREAALAAALRCEGGCGDTTSSRSADGLPLCSLCAAEFGEPAYAQGAE